jgi:hypothetical protein
MLNQFVQVGKRIMANTHQKCRTRFTATTFTVATNTLIGALMVIILQLPLAGGAFAEEQSQPSANPILAQIIDRLLASEARQAEKVSDVVLDSELFERRLKGNGEIKEEKRYLKEVYFRKVPDSARKMEVFERYLEFYKDGEKQSDNDLRKAVKDKVEKLKKGRGDDKARLLTDVFLPENAEFYSIFYEGIVDSAVENYTCYYIKVRAKENKDDLKERINAEFYIDTASARPVFVSFRPAEFKSNMMFKFKQLEMSLEFKEYQKDVWLPLRFYLRGKAKAALFFGVDFEANETFSNPRFDTGVEDIVFSEKMGS